MLTNEQVAGLAGEDVGAVALVRLVEERVRLRTEQGLPFTDHDAEQAYQNLTGPLRNDPTAAFALITATVEAVNAPVVEGGLAAVPIIDGVPAYVPSDTPRKKRR